MASIDEEDDFIDQEEDDEGVVMSDDDDDSMELSDDGDDVAPVRRRAVKEPESVIPRDILRAKLDADIRAFLERGGSIQKIDANVTADPPRRPESNYGQQPL